jgi:hypothetical protein
LATQAFIAAGYRGTLNARDLLDASKLGKGGYGGLPWWPPELWTKWGPPPAGLPQALGVTLTQDLLAGPLNPDGQSVLKGMAARHPEWTAYLNTILNTGEANGPTRKR